MAKPSYLVTLQKMGTPTMMSLEAMVETSPNVFSMPLESKRCFDSSRDFQLYHSIAPSHDPLGIPDEDVLAIDWLYGTVKLSSRLAWNEVRIIGYYIPLLYIGGANGYSLTIGGDVIDNTSFGVTLDPIQFRTKQYGMIDISATISRLAIDSDFVDHLFNRNRVLLRFNSADANSGCSYSGWFVIESAGQAGDQADLERESLSFVLAGDSKVAFSHNFSISQPT